MVVQYAHFGALRHGIKPSSTAGRPPSSIKDLSMLAACTTTKMIKFTLPYYTGYTQMCQAVSCS